jgi:predicted GH43/DUF377 family glycosyl hydrolase
MKKTLMVFFLSFFLLLIGCSKNNTVLNPTSNSTGGISFKFDPTSIPTGVTLISATLTRTGYTTVTKNLNLISDSTADVSIPAVQIGTWHLKVDAIDNNGTILYTGSTDVLVQENVVVQLNLTLNPVSTGMGTIYIFVTWGTNNSSQWIDYGGNPILTRNNNPSAPNGVNTAKIIYDNGIYKMWYDGIYNSAVSNIWYAESQDGLNWNTIGYAPVLSIGSGNAWDAYGVAVSAVIKVGSTYKMYYTGHNNYYDDIKTGIALSTDGINWTKNSAPIFSTLTGYYHFNFTDVIQKDSIYYGYYCCSASDNTTDGVIIGVGKSFDGISWQMQTIFNATLPWESGAIGFPTVVYENGIFKMIYQNTIGTYFGMATSMDGVNFTKAGNPIFTQLNSSNGKIGIWYPNFRKINSVYYLFYTGADSYNEQTLRVARNYDK